MAAFAAGSVTSAWLGEVAFDRKDLYSAMEQIHKQPNTNVLFPCFTGPKLTFKAPMGSARDMIRGAAKQYGRDAVQVNGVYVLEAPLPEGKAGLDRIKAAKDWAQDNFPYSSTAPSKYPLDVFRAFSDNTGSRA